MRTFELLLGLKQIIMLRLAGSEAVYTYRPLQKKKKKIKGDKKVQPY